MTFSIRTLRRLPIGPTVGTLVLLTAGLFVAPTANAATLELSGPAGALVTINDQPAGIFPLSGPLELAPGTYDIACNWTGYIPFQETVRLLDDDQWMRLQVRLTPLSRKRAWTANIPIAGLGQFYMGKDTKGWVFLTAEVGGLLTALVGETKRGDHRKDYLLLKSKYEAAVDPVDIGYYRKISDKAYSDMEDAESLRNTGLIVAGSAVVLSILDALLLFPSVEAGPGTVPPVSDWEGHSLLTNDNPFTTVHAGVRLNF